MEALQRQLVATHADLEAASENVRKLEEERDASRRNAQQIGSELERLMQHSMETKSSETAAREEAANLQRVAVSLQADVSGLQERLAGEEMERAVAEGEVEKLKAGRTKISACFERIRKCLHTLSAQETSCRCCSYA
jgi:uncharacterized protein (DUF3084 family)